MNTPINLNKVRKARNKIEAKRQAEENSVKYGRTKAERVLETAQKDAAKHRLDQLKFDDE